MPLDDLIVDRERFLGAGDVIGIAESVQGWSAHVGPYLLCFAHQGVVQRVQYLNQMRLVLDWNRRVDRPAAMQQQFEVLRGSDGGVRRAALPSEYLKGWIRHLPHD